MKQNLLFSLFVLAPTVSWAQDTKFKVAPFASIATSIKDGQIEVGPEFNWTAVDSVVVQGVKIPEFGNVFMLRPYLRLPLTNKTDNVLQIDRFTSTWRSILAVQYNFVNAESTGKISNHSFTGQFEFGQTAFKYYPTASKANEIETGKSSYGFEVKYINFLTSGKSGAKQLSHQARIRYSYDWKSAPETGVVNPVNGNGVITTTNYVISPPSAKPTMSLAYSLQYYPGKKSFSYSPTIYYDLTGEKNGSDPFSNLNRMRLECWIFYYPLISDNVKIGISPFSSIRTKGADDFRKIEYGGMVTVKFTSTFLQFL